MYAGIFKKPFIALQDGITMGGVSVSVCICDCTCMNNSSLRSLGKKRVMHWFECTVEPQSPMGLEFVAVIERWLLSRDTFRKVAEMSLMLLKNVNWLAVMMRWLPYSDHDSEVPLYIKHYCMKTYTWKFKRLVGLPLGLGLVVEDQCLFRPTYTFVDILAKDSTTNAHIHIGHSSLF